MIFLAFMFWLFDSANASFQKQLLYVHDKPSITSGLYLPVFLLGLLNTIVILLKPSTALDIFVFSRVVVQHHMQKVSSNYSFTCLVLGEKSRQSTLKPLRVTIFQFFLIVSPLNKICRPQK